MATRKRNLVLEQFILIYKSEPCLWKVKNQDYRNKEKKADAYDRLLVKLKELEPNATKEDVGRKINTLRSNVRRERRKHEDSVNSGAPPDEIYRPKLWYYKLFDFIEDQPSRLSYSRKSQSNNFDIEIDSDNSSDDNTDTITDNNTQNTETIDNKAEKKSRHIKKPIKIKADPEKSTHQVFITDTDHLNRLGPGPVQEDRYDLLGRTIAIKLRSIDKHQRLIAEKIINDTLFDAEMGNLSAETYWTTRNTATSPIPATIARIPST